MNIKGWTPPTLERAGWLLTIFAALALGLAGCSGSEQADKPVPAAEPAAPPTPPADPPVDPQTFPEVVARVNGSEIRQADLVARAKAVAGAHQAGTAVSAAFYRQVLDDLVSAELLYQESVSKGFAPNDKEVEERVAEIRGRFPSESEFKNALARQGLDEDRMKRALRKDLGIERMLRKEVLQSVEVGDAEARKFFDENSDKMKADDEVRVSHILVKADREASPSEKAAAQKKAAQLRDRALAGEDFAKLARENSDDPGSASLGGDLSWFGRGAMVGPFEDAAYALKPGDVSPVVATPFGFHVLKMMERRSGKPLTFEETKDQIAAFLKEKAIQEQIGAKVAALKKNATIEVFI